MKVAIVGGGIGGLTAAVALLRKGIEVDVFEQAPAVTPVGASLQLGPNALRLLDELGLLPALRSIGVLPEAVELRRWDDGSLLLRTELGDRGHKSLRKTDPVELDEVGSIVRRGLIHLALTFARVADGNAGAG